MIKLIDTHISFGDRPILGQVNWMLGESDRVGLVGGNGSGKSTLMKIMAGIQEFDHGKREVSRGLKIGYLPQEGIHHKGRTLEEEAREALKSIVALETEKEEIEITLEKNDFGEEKQNQLLMRMAELIDEFGMRGGYELDAKINKVLTGLGFKEDEFGRPVESFSGGWQMRLALAKLLLAEPHVLLLDEPTNHLDIEARMWLENFLKEYEYSFLIVSHDRYFLDRTIQKIIEIENGVITDYRGHYSYYMMEKEKRTALAWTAYEKQQDELQRHQFFINKYKADKKRASQVQSRVKMVERIEIVEPPLSVKPVHFNFPDPPRGPQEVAVLSNIVKSYGDNVVLSHVDVKLFRGEKVAVVGINGAGKSTLLDVLAGKKDFSEGERKISDGVLFEYFGQTAGEDLVANETVLDSISRNAPIDMYPRLRNLLGAFLFSGDDVEKKVSVLSGGEKSRLALAKLLLKPTNMILLDEPTNHLDLSAKEVLMGAFKKYSGTLVFVAHDRYFLDELPDRVLEVKDGKITSFIGDYTDYLHARELLDNSATETKPPVHSAQTISIENKKKEKLKPVKKKMPLDAKALAKKERMKKREEEKAKQRRKNKRKREVQILENDIAALEAKISKLDRKMSDPKIASDFTKLMEFEVEKKSWAEKLETLYNKWENLES